MISLCALTSLIFCSGFSQSITSNFTSKEREFPPPAYICIPSPLLWVVHLFLILISNSFTEAQKDWNSKHFNSSPTHWTVGPTGKWGEGAGTTKCEQGCLCYWERPDKRMRANGTKTLKSHQPLGRPVPIRMQIHEGHSQGSVCIQSTSGRRMAGYKEDWGYLDRLA